MSSSSPGTGGGDFGVGGRGKAPGAGSGGTEASAKEGTNGCLLKENVSTQKAPRIERRNIERTSYPYSLPRQYLLDLPNVKGRVRWKQMKKDSLNPAAVPSSWRRKRARTEYA